MKRKYKLKDDEEIIAQEGDITINMKELKTSLPKLADKLNDVDIRIVLKKLMLDIEVRFEILQHALKSGLDKNIQIISDTQKTIDDTNKLLDEIKQMMDGTKK